MDRIRLAWSRFASSPRRLVAAVATGIAAILLGVGFALAVGGVRQPGAAGASVSELATASASASASASPTASPSPTPSPSPTASPTPTPTPSPTPAPIVTAVPSPTPTPWPTTPPPPDPGTCDTFAFVSGDITVSTLAELQDGIVGTWVGCVTTPWVAPYQVTVTFRDDGTYSAVAEEGSSEPAFYYGSDEDSPEKRYEINDLQDDLEGVGQIDIWFWQGNINRGDLRNIRLMGNALQFEFFHRGQYGPLVYQLYRVETSD